jgi:hypothetical protein
MRNVGNKKIMKLFVVKIYKEKSSYILQGVKK